MGEFTFIQIEWGTKNWIQLTSSTVNGMQIRYSRVNTMVFIFLIQNNDSLFSIRKKISEPEIVG